MSTSFQLSRGQRAAWVAGLLVLLLVSTAIVFGLTNDSLREGQGSPLVREYTTVSDADGEGSEASFPATFGEEGKASTLVLYDKADNTSSDGELYAVATGNLVSHFGTAEIKPVAEYVHNAMTDYDAVVYIGTDAAATPPPAFLDDVLTLDTPVMWVGENLNTMTSGQSDRTAQFRSEFGWDAGQTQAVSSDLLHSVRYNDKDVARYTDSTETLESPVVEPGSSVEVLASAQCRKDDAPVSCEPGKADGAQDVPWAVRSENLTFVSEIPLDYIDENDVYLIYSDLFYGLLAPDTAPVKQAAVRLEDVGPESDPADLRTMADYFQEAGVPFQVAVMPIHMAKTPEGDDWYGLSLLDRPEVVDALKYMQERGGTLVQHGTTHQFGTLDNPYSGRSGEDYEFYRYGCSATARQPYKFGECTNTSYIRQIGRIAEDSVAQHTARIEKGRQVMIDAGLGEPEIFETPHYAASPNAYAAMTDVYDARYEQSDYFAGILSGEPSEAGRVYSQHFPYTVHDIYGSTVYPENLGNITESEQNNHATRDPEFLISRAEAHLAVRESTASFFFHPYLDVNYLKKTVEGIQELGYEFVPVTELK
ncbi:polysaccharide deacetylase family protein [Kocuria sp. cx-455]|uniref:DUF2334 domain-containing protein n=1 Tax=Kocuria sp. cx-455 TaxID=2771377 RepID=UPI001689DEEF|nr:polysaccharide deacetylase family protein [Kocuria sp. cx-455]MBD2764231.1 polysaccharide deacetylase family protein [Kocuria sp. cx-455]